MGCKIPYNSHIDARRNGELVGSGKGAFVWGGHNLALLRSTVGRFGCHLYGHAPSFHWWHRTHVAPLAIVLECTLVHITPPKSWQARLQTLACNVISAEVVPSLSALTDTMPLSWARRWPVNISEGCHAHYPVCLFLLSILFSICGVNHLPMLQYPVMEGLTVSPLVSRPVAPVTLDTTRCRSLPCLMLTQ